jgi:hypothetical protein
MSPQEARDTLLLYRPVTGDSEDPQMAEAMDLARRDGELGQWFEQHLAFQKAMRSRLRQIEVPAELKASLLAQKTPQPEVLTVQAWWRNPALLAAAAVVTLLVGLAGFWLKGGAPDRFANFQARMVGTALREYRMDIVTSDMGRLRQFMADSGAPADYHVPPGLEKLQLTGGGLLRWRSNPVAMVCFNRGDDQMLFLFVMDRSALKDPPSEKPKLAKLDDMTTVSWSRGGKTYLLAGQKEADFARKYLSSDS